MRIFCISDLYPGIGHYTAEEGREESQDTSVCPHFAITALYNSVRSALWSGIVQYGGPWVGICQCLWHCSPLTPHICFNNLTVHQKSTLHNYLINFHISQFFTQSIQFNITHNNKINSFETVSVKSLITFVAKVPFHNKNIFRLWFKYLK